MPHKLEFYGSANILESECLEGKSRADKSRSKAHLSRQKRTDLGIRRRIDPATTDIDYTIEEIEFFRAMQEYKEVNHRPFPTLKETLEVLMKIGYRKI